MARLNDGSRPSRLAISRQLAGEAPLPAPHADAPEVQDWGAQVAAARPPAFDPAALRARAAALRDEAPAPATSGVVLPFARRAAPWVGALAALAAALFLVVRPPERDGSRLKGETRLEFYVQRDGHSFDGDPDAEVRPGDRLQFAFHPGAYGTVVLVGVDGTGTVQTYWPDDGGAPLAATPGERQLLDGSIQLDDAPGPEVFVAGFAGQAPAALAAEVGDAWEAGGVEAIVALDEARPDLAILVLEKP